jgi:sugar phosphate isomerase/epimerase
MDRRAFLATGAAWAAGCALPGPAAPAPFRISLAAYSLRKHLDLKKPSMTLEGFLEKCAEWRVAGAELTEYYFPKPVTPAAVAALRARAAALGIAITGTPVGNTFTLPPGEAREREIARVKDWIDVSADLGSPAVRIFAGNTPKGTDEAVAREWAVECIRACLPKAAERRVALALENHGGIVARAEGMLAIAGGIDSPWFGFNLDTGNFRVDDPYAELERIAPRAITCQVKVEMPSRGGHEPTDLGRITAMLRRHGYAGWLTLEYEATGDPLEAIPRHLDALRRAAV